MRKARIRPMACASFFFPLRERYYSSALASNEAAGTSATEISLEISRFAHARGYSTAAKFIRWRCSRDSRRVNAWATRTYFLASREMLIHVIAIYSLATCLRPSTPLTSRRLSLSLRETIRSRLAVVTAIRTPARKTPRRFAGSSFFRLAECRRWARGGREVRARDENREQGYSVETSE